MKISIIIPVYNVENYIRRCLDSIVNQTYQNIEIIIINDGSPDKCGTICDEYKELDSRIIVIHKKNEGVSVARNSGLLIASGDYVYFLDSDDYLTENTIEILYKNAIKSNADITISNHIFFDENGFHWKRSNYKISSIDKKNFMDSSLRFKYFFGKSFGVQVWNKLYKTSFIKENNVDFDRDLYIAEDFLFNFKLFTHKPKICLINDYTYYYFQNTKSVTHSYKENLTELYIQMIKKMHQHLSELNIEDKYQDILSYRAFTSIDGSGLNIYNYSKQKLRDIKTELIKFQKCDITNRGIRDLAKWKYLKDVPRNDWKYYAWVFSLAYTLNLINIAALIHLFRFTIQDMCFTKCLYHRDRSTIPETTDQ